MSSTASPTSDSPLTVLQREAEADMDSEVEDLLGDEQRTDSGTKMHEWRRCTLELREQEDDEDDEEIDGSGKSPATPRSAGPTHEEMLQIFPPIKRSLEESEDTGPPNKVRHNRFQAHQLRQTKVTKKQSNTPSKMGLFALLPGELRNQIYRLAFVPPPPQQPVRITGSDLICGQGACIHRQARIAAPGMASTCHQIRHELLPLYCGENAFRFDSVMVRNRCVHAWAKCLKAYARLIRHITLEIEVLDRIPGATTRSRIGEVRIQCPAEREDGRFEVGFCPIVPEDKIERSGIVGLVEGLNGDVKSLGCVGDGGGMGEKGRASKLVFLLGSDELAELVFRCKK